MALIPNIDWGGDGSIGCNIGYGYLHRIPVKQPTTTTTNTIVPAIPPSQVTVPPQNSTLVIGDELTEVPLLVPSQPSTPVSTIDNKMRDLSLSSDTNATIITMPNNGGFPATTEGVTPIVTPIVTIPSNEMLITPAVSTSVTTPLQVSCDIPTTVQAPFTPSYQLPSSGPSLIGETTPTLSFPSMPPTISLQTTN